MTTTTKQTFLHPEIPKFINTGIWRRLWIVAGGQSGVDRAALDLALELHLPTRGWCPSERWAEDGPIAPQYPVQDTSSKEPAMRTEMNAFDSDGTLVLTAWQPKDGTKLTEDAARLHSKPVFEIDLSVVPVPDKTVQDFRKWITDNDIRILNIGGPRESLRPGHIYSNTQAILRALLTD